MLNLFELTIFTVKLISFRLLYSDDSVKSTAGILHTIVFHRALGLVRPKDIDLELFEITYVSYLSLLFLECISLLNES